ncbi:uncharacterized protein A4U43_C02F4790 [Asparagus officinalis]|uniref:Uncharacterized protein n=1 Tax=Asparagus officinalis TaxID=4686 RepID=A0A5P1FIN1_ASPOF|nr:uncharacterized protein A4U43_C02F4790 [Asparagus officinalis]
MSKLKQALNYMEILKEAIKLILMNPKLILKILFFILFPLNLILSTFNKLNLLPLFTIKRGNRIIFEVELVANILQWLTTTLTISLLSKAYLEKPSSMLQLSSTLKRQWKKIFATSIFVEFITFTCSFLLVGLGYPLKDATFLSFIMVMIEFSLFVLVNLACKLSLVVSGIEERSCRLFGVYRAIEIVRGRKVQCFALMALMVVLDSIVKAEVVVVLQIVWCSVYCMLYLESKKREGTEEDEERWIV